MKKEPPKWKMYLITFTLAYVLSSIIFQLLSLLVPNWPFLVVNAIGASVLVFLLIYGGLPLATHLLRSWLEGCQEPDHSMLDMFYKDIEKNLSKEENIGAIGNSPRTVQERERPSYRTLDEASVNSYRSAGRSQPLSSRNGDLSRQVKPYYYPRT